jgi:putative transposase
MIGVTKFGMKSLKIFMLYYLWSVIQFPSMANTFSCLNIHCVFSTKERVSVLNPDIRERLGPYMGGIAKQNGMIPKCIGGVSDHVHLLVTLPTRMAVAKALQLIKARSSGWIHQTFPNLRNFAWQKGYGAFSVGISQVQETIHYIEQQLEHHRTRTFQEEYLALFARRCTSTSLGRLRKVLRRRNPHRNIDTGQSFDPKRRRLDPLDRDKKQPASERYGRCGH